MKYSNQIVYYKNKREKDFLIFLPFCAVPGGSRTHDLSLRRSREYFPFLFIAVQRSLILSGFFNVLNPFVLVSDRSRR